MSAHVFSMKVHNYYWGHYSLCLQREMGPTFYLEQLRAVWCFSTCHTVTVLCFYPQCLLFTALPFAEDLRQFSFAPLDANKKWKPTGNLYNLCLNVIAIILN